MRWTNEQTQYLIDNYLINDYKTIANKLGIKEKMVCSKIFRLGLKKGSGPNTKYSINSSFFDIWSKDMAYILGYIMADGCVTDDYRFICQCQFRDIEILEFIKNKLSPNRPIQISYKKYKGKYLKTSRFEFKDIYLVKALNNLNIIPRKTKKEILPNIPDEYKADYLRGFFDGDGCIHYGLYLDKRDNVYYRQQSFTLVSGERTLLENIKSSLCFNYGSIYKRKNCFVLRTSNKNHIKDIAIFMYEKDSFSLKRKKDKFRELGLI